MSSPPSLPLRPRAALIPMATLGSLDGISEALAAPTLAVSLQEETPTHLLVLGDPLPPAFAASAVLAGGRLLFAKPDSNCFAEGSEPLPEPNAGVWTLRLGGSAEPLLVSGTPSPLERFLSVNWTPLTLPFQTCRRPEIRIESRQSSNIRPTAALILGGPDRSDLEEMLFAFPETRFRGIRFVANAHEVILCSSDPRPLEGIAGAAFHAIPLEAGKTLYFPLGRELVPAFAEAWLHELLGPEGDLFFWRQESILSLNSAALLPFNRRTWHSQRQADVTH